MSKKLSEKLQAEADSAGGHGETFGREHASDLGYYAAEARDLEARFEKAEAERKAFMLEAQENEAAANRMASDLNAAERENERLGAALEAAERRDQEMRRWVSELDARLERAYAYVQTHGDDQATWAQELFKILDPTGEE